MTKLPEQPPPEATRSLLDRCRIPSFAPLDYPDGAAGAIVRMIELAGLGVPESNPIPDSVAIRQVSTSNPFFPLIGEKSCATCIAGRHDRRGAYTGLQGQHRAHQD